MQSFWSSTNCTFPALRGDIKTDVLIIGGGIAGVLTAYTLQQSGVDCVLVEQDVICSKTTANTTAKITAQHGFIYFNLIQRFGKEKARLYYDANNQALQRFKELCKDIECDFEEKSSYVYSSSSAKKVEKELKALSALNVPAQYVKDLPLPVETKGAVMLKGQAQFNPVKFVQHLAKNLTIYEQTRAVEFEPGRVRTDNGRIFANKIIFATHFPFWNKKGLYFMKMFQHRSYVVALKNAPYINGMYLDDDSKGLSFRNYKDYLLLGGGAHRTGEKGGGWKELEKVASEKFANSEITHKWATQDCMTLDGVPYIGRYSSTTQDVYVATGFNKWGMTSAMVASNLLCDAVCGKKSPYAQVFNPSRTILRPQLFINLLKTAVNLVTPTVPRCTHLGCALKYNKQERSWDCCCHGSRFSEDKQVLDNPAMKDLD